MHHRFFALRVKVQRLIKPLLGVRPVSRRFGDQSQQAIAFGGGLGARANVGIGLSPNFLELGADLLFPFGAGRLLPYGGIGGNWVGLGALNFFGIRGLAGVNYSTSGDAGLFAEAVPTLYLASDATGIYGTAFGIQIRFGVNYLF